MERQVFKLGTICSKIGSGATPSGGKEAYKGGGYKLVRSQNVVDLSFSWDGLAEISEEQAIKLNNVKVEENDVLLNITGDSVARSCLAPKTILPARVNQHVSIIRPKTDILNPHYLLFWLIINKQYLLALASTGATRNALTRTMIKGLTLELPSLDVQHRIASILSTYNTMIENNTKRIRLLEKMAENLYKEWFVRFRFPGYEKVEIENGLPKGWKIIKIGDVCESIGGGTPSTSGPSYWNGNIKWVTPTDVTSKNSMPLLDVKGRITEEGLAHSSAKLLPPYTILMTSRASIGYSGVNIEPVCTNQGFISIVPNKDNMLMYFLYMLKSRREEIVGNANGSTFLEISKGRFRKMKMVLPAEELLDSFQQREMQIFKMVLSLSKQNTLLASQRDLLLPRLMSGKLEVKP